MLRFLGITDYGTIHTFKAVPPFTRPVLRKIYVVVMPFNSHGA